MSPKNLEGDTTLSHFLETQYQLRGTILKLVAYQDRNYLVTCSSGVKYILKVTIDGNDLEFIRSQNRILLALSQKPAGRFLPCPVSSILGDLISAINLDGHPAYARLFPFIEGDFLAEATPDIQFYFELGKVFGEIDSGMDGLEDAVLKCRTHEWDLARVTEVAEDVQLVEDPADRRLVHYFLMKYREVVLPVYHKLPKGLIHGDGNDWNILVASKGPRLLNFVQSQGVPAFAGMTEQGLRRDKKGDTSPVAGVIDFGDMVWGARVNEVAIVLAYAMMGREDFREVFQEVIKGYQEVIRLSDLELSVIYYLVAARWCQTMVMAARQERQNPGSAYHQVSVQGARAMLHVWIRENPVKDVMNEKNVGAIPRSPLDAIPRSPLDAIPRSPLDMNPISPVDERYGYFSKAVSLSYQEPIHMVGAAMQYMYSADGRTYLDCVNNIPHVGHCHPKVVEAGQRQMARLNTNTRYIYNSLDRYAEKLLSKFPPSLNKVFFVNSGSAATDLAVRLAEAHTGRCEYLVLDYAYHGNTRAAIGLSPFKFNRKGGKGKPENVTILNLAAAAGPSPGPLDHSGVSGPPPSPLPGPPPDPLLRKEGERSPRTFFAESIVGCAGQIVLSKELMQQTVKEVREAGGIYVADEVQTGFGRVGHKFWAYELYDVVPDIVVLGKPMGNGHPIGAVVCTEEIAGSFETGMEFFSSFGGNPVSCEIGLAVLEVIEEEGLQENARLVGDFLIGELESLFSRQSAAGSRQSAAGSRQSAAGSRQSAAGSRQSAAGSRQSAAGRSDHASRVTFFVSDVRGSGLFLGIELTDPETGNPATEAAVSIVNAMKERGFLLSTDGPFNNVIKFKPPMCFSLENSEELVTALKAEVRARK